MNIQKRMEEIEAAKRHLAGLISSLLTDLQRELGEPLLRSVSEEMFAPPPPVTEPSDSARRVRVPHRKSHGSGFRKIPSLVKARALKAIKGGKTSMAQIARDTGINESTLYQWKKDAA